MSITTLALKVVGPTLAKSLVSSLGIESKLANSLANKTIDTVAGELLKPSANSVSLSEKIEALAKQMADDLRPLFEGSDPQNTNREAVLLGLAQTLTQAGLSQAGLAELNFDVAALEQHLLRINPDVDRDFSAGEKWKYKQAVEIASRRLIEAAPGVAGYELAKTTEVLQRLESLALQLGVERDLAIQAADHFVGRYRGVVQDKLDRLEVFGLPRMDRLTSQQSLSMAYITLSASGVDRRAGDRKQALLADAREMAGSEFGTDLGNEPRRILGQVDEVMCDCRRLVIRGGAGAGKSTLMQWLAVQAASMGFTGKLTAWNTKIPFFIRLRSLVGQGFPAPEDWPVLIAKTIAAQMPDGWVHRYLELGQALVLIDGVDELPRQAREDFFEALQDLVRDFPQATYLITSRPSGLKSEEGGLGRLGKIGLRRGNSRI